jgi:hypothetical protein
VRQLVGKGAGDKRKKRGAQDQTRRHGMGPLDAMVGRGGGHQGYGVTAGRSRGEPRGGTAHSKRHGT